jgi:group II intron reverse transcriptase/maturase
MMQTSLLGIANKAARDKTHRFRSLARLLSVGFLMWCWSFINKKAASGIDNVSAKEYKVDLKANIENLVGRLKAGNYKAKLIRRQYIPKENGKLRPLGIPAIEDKLLQTGAKTILESIYEQDFLPCSYGYRPRRGATEALNDLYAELQTGRYHYIVEADIKGYFDNIDHEVLIKLLNLRIDDKSFMRLLKKWLKAGILDIDDKVISPATGTPQGGIISPLLANIYLHYALDLWVEEIVKTHSSGQVYLCRYADDWVCAFQDEYDAVRFYQEVAKRLALFNLQLAEDKTNLIRFSRYAPKNHTHFDFLGFEFRWTKSRIGKKVLKRRTSPKKLRKAIVNFTLWCKGNCQKRLSILFMEINRKLRGYYNYYGLPGNSKALANFFYWAKINLFKWLNRRSQRKSYTWQAFNDLMRHFNLLKPRIIKRPIQLRLGFI